MRTFMVVRVHDVIMSRHVLETFHAEALESVPSCLCRRLGLVHTSDEFGENPAKYIGTLSIGSVGRRMTCRNGMQGELRSVSRSSDQCIISARTQSSLQ